jgi:hypothetical protein
MWKSIVEPDRPQMTIWKIRIACWIPKATNTLLDYVILIVFYCNNGCTNASHPCVIVHSLSFCFCFGKSLYFLQKLVLAQSGMGWHEPWSGRRRLDYYKIHHNTQSDYKFHTALCPLGPSFAGNAVRNLNPITEHMATVLKLLTCVVDAPRPNLIRDTHYLEQGFCVFFSLFRQLPE